MPQVGRDPPAATHPTERNNENENENENENSRTPAGPQTNAPRDNLTPCGSPTPHSNNTAKDIDIEIEIAMDIKIYPTRRRAAIPPPRFLGGFEATEKIFKNQLKIDQQINEHRSKIDQK